MAVPKRQGHKKHNDAQLLVANAIRIIGGIATNIVSSNRRGTSDIIASYKYVAMYVEVKVGRDTLSSFQKKFFMDIKAGGAIAIVVHIDYIKEFIEYMLYLKARIDNHDIAGIHETVPMVLRPPKLDATKVESGGS